jgi:hypothetical protein
MKLKHFIFSLGILSLVACVTEPKPPADTNPYVATVPPQQVPDKPVTSTAAAAALKSKSDSIPGHIVVKCHIENDKSGKLFQCGPTTVKLINELSKSTSEHTFKGERTAIPVAYDGSYMIEISTKGCNIPRKYAGMTSGMGVTVQFENCGAK